MTEEQHLLHVGAHAVAHPDRPVAVMVDTGESVDYATVDRRSTQLARVFAAEGCGLGDHVAILLETHLRYPEVCWAAYRTGLRYTPVNTQLKVDEAAFVINDCGAQVVVTSIAQRQVAEQLPALCPGVSRWLMIDGVIDGFTAYEGLVEAQDDGPLDNETEGSAMIYSSGTTGRPKGIKRPLSGNPVGATLFGVDPSVGRGYGLGEDSVALIPLPLYHSSGMTRLMMVLGFGGTVVLMAKFDPEGALAAVERYRVTQGLWVPTMFIRLLRLDEATRQKYDLSTMTDATVGSGPCAPAVKQAIIDWWGPIVTESYGGTEGIGMTRISSPEALERPGSVGRPVFGVLHIVKDDGTEVGPNETGVIYFEGGRPFEYYNDPEKTASVHNDQGWATLGDIGHVDDDGYLYLTDRQTDVVISGGVNIYPREVEEVLLSLPEVDDAAVIGVPDPEFGESVKAVVKVRDGVDAGPELEAALIAACRSRLASYKCPRSVDFVDDLPRQATGKLFKRILRDRYREPAASQPAGQQPAAR